jgi:molybdenum cofactor cytidylyltransferase
VIEPSKVVAILLAAGASRRFGAADKLLADYHGRPLVAWAADAAMALPFRAVLGVCRQAGPAAGLLHDAGLTVHINPAPERGMGSSIAVGVAAARAFDPDAVLVLLGDMPAVTPAHLEAVLAAFDTTADVIVSTAAGRRMPPSLFARRHFPTLLTLDGDTGARALAAEARTVEVPAAALGDIDRPEDLLES